MSILTGFKRFKKFIKTDNGYMPSYDKTIASAVCFGDGTDDTDTVESRLSGIKGITTSNSVTETGYAADASVVSEISNDITEIQNNIGTLNSSLASLKNWSRFYLNTNLTFINGQHYVDTNNVKIAGQILSVTFVMTSNNVTGFASIDGNGQLIITAYDGLTPVEGTVWTVISGLVEYSE